MKLFKDANGNIVFTGTYNSDFFVARLDGNGTGCAFTNTSVISSTNANTVLTNISFTTTAFTPTTVNETPVYSALAVGETMLCGGVGINEEVQSRELMVYPNPVTGKLAIGGSEHAINSVEIYNSIGEMVQAFQFPENNGLASVEMNVQALSPGIYFISVLDGEKIYRSKFIKE